MLPEAHFLLLGMAGPHLRYDGNSLDAIGMCGWRGQGLTLDVGQYPRGWEGLAQVDLLAWLFESFGATATRRWDAERNVRVYNDTALWADLVFNGSTHDASRSNMVVEVVAESLVEESTAYLQRMHLRSERLRPGSLAPSNAGARRVVLALTVDLATASELQRYEFGVVAMTKGGCAVLWRGVGGGRVGGWRAAVAMDGWSGVA